MTDKQIKLDGSFIPIEEAIKAGLISEKDINVPSKNNKYRLGRTKIERQQIFEDIKEMIENGFSLQNIADKYGVTRQAISLKMINCGFNVSQEVKRIKREKIKKLLEETSVNNVEKLNRKVKYYKTYNIRLRNDLTELKEKLKAKEQECETLASQLDFEVQKKECLEQECERLKGVSMQKCPQCAEVYLNPIGCELYEQLDQLKADNKHLNGLLDQALKELEEHREALEKVKELIQKEINDCEHCDDCSSCEYNCCTKQILQMCDEVNE